MVWNLDIGRSKIVDSGVQSEWTFICEPVQSEDLAFVNKVFSESSDDFGASPDELIDQTRRETWVLGDLSVLASTGPFFRRNAMKAAPLMGKKPSNAMMFARVAGNVEAWNRRWCHLRWWVTDSLPIEVFGYSSSIKNMMTFKPRHGHPQENLEGARSPSSILTNTRQRFEAIGKLLEWGSTPWFITTMSLSRIVPLPTKRWDC